MTQGYYLSGKGQDQAVFDLFYRQNPYGGGYAVAAGLVTRSTTFSTWALHVGGTWLPGFARLSGRLSPGALQQARGSPATSPPCPKARVVFRGSPSSVSKGQLDRDPAALEGLILSTVNFQTLIATKARRMVSAAEGRSVYDFGLRRAQGDGGMGASRACFVGGSRRRPTSCWRSKKACPWAGRWPTAGSRASARSWRRSAPTHRCIRMTSVLLLDTYDTLKQGLPNAVIVGQELEAGATTSGASGWIRRLCVPQQEGAGRARRAWTQPRQDLGQQPARRVRHRVARDEGAPIDIFGVGTRLVTGHSDGALDGVYKMVRLDGRPIIKISENPAKINIPGEKELYRYYDSGDWSLAARRTVPGRGRRRAGRPDAPGLRLQEDRGGRPEAGEHSQGDRQERRARVHFPTLLETSAWGARRFAQLYGEHKRFANPHAYHIGLSRELFDLRRSLIEARSS